MPDTPVYRKLRSESNPNNPLTLKDIKTLIESSKTELLSFMKKEVDGLAELLKCLVKRVDEIERVNVKLEERCAKLEEKQEHIISEIEERQRRQPNLIISGIPERQSGNSEERKAHDKEHVNDLLSELHVSDVTFKTTYRIGKPEKNRNRLLRVICHDKEDKMEILKKATKLRDSKHFKKTYINPDLTPMQQLQQKELRQELKRRRDANERVIIRHGKIVQLDKKDFQ